MCDGEGTVALLLLAKTRRCLPSISYRDLWRGSPSGLPGTGFFATKAIAVARTGFFWWAASLAGCGMRLFRTRWPSCSLHLGCCCCRCLPMPHSCGRRATAFQHNAYPSLYRHTIRAVGRLGMSGVTACCSAGVQQNSVCLAWRTSSAAAFLKNRQANRRGCAPLTLFSHAVKHWRTFSRWVARLRSGH